MVHISEQSPLALVFLWAVHLLGAGLHDAGGFGLFSIPKRLLQNVVLSPGSYLYSPRAGKGTQDLEGCQLSGFLPPVTGQRL